MGTGLIISLAAGAAAGLLAGAELRFVQFRRLGVLFLGAIGGGVGLTVAARIAANAPDGGVLVPGLTDAAIAALVPGALGGAVMVALSGVVGALLTES